MHRNEPLIHDERIGLPGLAVRTQANVARETGLIGSDPWDFATDVEHTVCDELRLAGAQDIGAGIRERIRSRY